MDPRIRIAADVGGTFTDLVVIGEHGELIARKVPSTPPEFDRGVLEAIEAVIRDETVSASRVAYVNHGATVATNAVLERRGAKTALITTAGFRDVLELRRMRAPQIYNLFFEKPPSLVDRRFRLEVGERISADGQVLQPVNLNDLERVGRILVQEGVESVAVCFLHSYAYPQHEEIVGDYLRQALPDLPVSLSHQVLRQIREYERTATTVVNAYVRPVMRRYLESLRKGLEGIGVHAPLLMMQSAGGLTPAEDAAERPVYSLESGPSAGVLAASWIASSVEAPNVISFDMGGTTAKASIIEDGEIPYSAEYEVGSTISAGNRLTGGGGETILAPSIDIAEVGAGGGSIAYLDAAGGIRVGPRSAGADPGPVSYRNGGVEPTVTDANVVLGYIKSGRLANGEVTIDPDAAKQSIEEKIARPLGLDVIDAALGIHRIANSQMLRALREVSTQRGRDPRRFTLVAFGGSGPIHAAGLAGELGSRRVIIPPMPGVFSAVGLLVSGIEHHDVRSCRLVGESLTAKAIDNLICQMKTPMIGQFQTESVPVERLKFSIAAEVRYHGQASQIRVPVNDSVDGPSPIERMTTNFEEEHELLYGHRAEAGSDIEVVAVRLIGRAAADIDVEFGNLDGTGASGETRLAAFGPPWGQIETPLVARAALRGGKEGPLIIDEYDATIVIPPGWRAEFDEFGNIVMESVDGSR
jgi:N-methylhydantoinase A